VSLERGVGVFFERGHVHKINDVQRQRMANVFALGPFASPSKRTEIVRLCPLGIPE
jgi:hypothetical protein